MVFFRWQPEKNSPPNEQELQAVACFHSMPLLYLLHREMGSFTLRNKERPNKNGLRELLRACAVLSHSKEMELLMSNLETIIVIAAVLAVVVSSWAIIYFAGLIITKYRIRRELGDMPSQEELREHYRLMNGAAYGDYSPIAKPRGKQRKSTLQ
jgi:hypothetical protein